MLISNELSRLPYVFPSQYPEKKRNGVADVWKKIIFEGAGFNLATGALKEPLKLYLKDKSRCGGNFVKFCDQFWGEILEPHLKQTKGNKETVDRVFTIFQTIAEGYIEGDLCGVRNSLDLPLNNRISLIDIFDFLTLSIIKEFFIPWSLYTTLAPLLRYRSARQCSVGLSHLAHKWKEFSSHQGASIKDAFDRFKAETKAAAAQSSRVRGVVQRDEKMKISEIKDLQAFRLTSTIVRVAVVAVAFFLIIGALAYLYALFPKMILFILIEQPAFLPWIIFLIAELNPQGTCKNILQSLLSLHLKCMTVGSTFVIIQNFKRHMAYSVIFCSTPVIETIGLLGLLGVISYIFMGIVGACFLAKLQESHFYANTLQNDPWAPFLGFISRKIGNMMDGALYLVDGADLALNL